MPSPSKKTREVSANDEVSGPGAHRGETDQIASLVHEIGTFVTSSLDARNTLIHLAAYLLHFSELSVCSIYRWDHEQRQMLGIAEKRQITWPQNTGPLYRLSSYPLLERVLQTGEPAAINPESDAEHPLLEKRGLWAGLVYPLYAGGDVIGLMRISSPYLRLTFDQAVQRNYQQILRRVAGWLTPEHLARTDSRLMEMVSTILDFSTDAVCSVLSWQEGSSDIRGVIEYGDLIWSHRHGPSYHLYDNPFAQKALRENRIVTIDRHNLNLPPTLSHQLDRWRVEELSFYPLYVRGKPVGLIELMGNRSQTIDAAPQFLVDYVGNQIGQTIYLSQLQEAERYGRAMSETLRKTTEALLILMGFEKTVQIILEQIQAELPYDQALVMVIEGDQMYAAAARGFPEEEYSSHETAYAYLDNSLIRDAIAHISPIILVDAHQFPESAELPAVRPSTRSWVGMPVSLGRKAAGLICLASNQANIYDSRDLDQIQAFATQIGVALESVRSLDELETDISSLQQAKAQMVRTMRLSAVGDLTTGIAHQINNPLTAILVETHLLMRQFESDTPHHATLASIQEAASRAGKVVQRMLDFARSSPFIQEPVDVNHSIQNAVTAAREQASPQLQFVLELAPALPLIYGSEEHLERVWKNLLSNARDALENSDSGIIIVTTRLDPGGQVAEIKVADNGVGIPVENLEKIFDPFFTTKEQGTGLGLSVCHDIVTRHGGTIRAESEKGRGTIVSVMLPIVSRVDSTE